MSASPPDRPTVDADHPTPPQQSPPPPPPPAWQWAAPLAFGPSPFFPPLAYPFHAPPAYAPYPYPFARSAWPFGYPPHGVQLPYHPSSPNYFHWHPPPGAQAVGYPDPPPPPSPAAAHPSWADGSSAVDSSAAAQQPMAAPAAAIPSDADPALGGADELPADPFGVEAEPAGNQQQAPMVPPPPPPPPPAAQQQQPHEVKTVRLVPLPPAKPPAGAAASSAGASSSTASPSAGASGSAGAKLTCNKVHRQLPHAQACLRQLLPGLQPELHAWLLHQLVLLRADPADVKLSSQEAVVPLNAALDALQGITAGPPQKLAEAAAGLLEGLKQRFLAGGDLLGSAALAVRGEKQASLARKKPGNADWEVLLQGLDDPAALSQAVLRILTEPSLAVPQLPEVQPGGKQKQALPAAPPPPARGSVQAPPAALAGLFKESSSGGGVLRGLLKAALERLDAATALAAHSPGARQDSQSNQLQLAVSADIDFGTVPVTRLSASELVGAAASAAAGLPTAGAGSSLKGQAAAAAGSLLDLLHLASSPQQQQAGAQQPGNGSAAAGTAGGAPASSSGSSSSNPGSVLHFRQMVVDNSSYKEPLWLLGGVAAPDFPHTFACVDDGRLFWLEGHQAVHLGPRQQHTISVALSSADCAARRQESGILQQLLLLIFAARAGSQAAQQLGELDGVAFADLPAALPVGASEAAVAAAAAAAALGPGFRLFVVARRVTVALVDRPGEVASLLSVEAKPFIAEHLRKLFDSVPLISSWGLFEFQAPTCQLLCTGSSAGPGATHAPWPASPPAEEPPLRRMPACRQKGLAVELCLPVDTLQSPAAALLQKYSRLLAVEEAAMEQDICRYDQYNVRLRLALFSGDRLTRYRLASLAPPAAMHAEGGGPGRLYRGPAVDLLQPGGIGAGEQDGLPVYALGVLEVPGLPEGRPTLLIGDTVYLRTAQHPQRELAALVAATDGNTAFLLLPAEFWGMADVKPLVAALLARPSPDSAPAPPGFSKAEGRAVFDGLIHARFSFDRSAMRRMQAAISHAASQQLSSRACWLPAEGGTGGRGAPAAAPSSPGRQHQQDSSSQQLALERFEALQPLADAVAATAAGIQERGARKLNTEQRQAVAAVLCGAGRAMPYALFGPPGTGKTVTLVECALQLMGAYPQARLLLCAPQNYSADLLAAALAAAGMGRSELLRMNDPRRPPYTVKEDVLPFSQLSERSRMFTLPSRRDIESRRAVVCTCAAAALLREGVFEGAPLTFTHVLIDEAGQALPPEALVPLALLAPPRPDQAVSDPGWGAVLCGDPRQLGPVVRSRLAAGAGLATSLLELCICHHGGLAYDVLKTGRVPPTSTLLRNYRSHRRLLDLPSRLFYQGSLLAAADQRSVQPPKWEELEGAEEEGEDGPEAVEPAAAAAAGEAGLPVEDAAGRQEAVQEVEEAAGQEEGLQEEVVEVEVEEEEDEEEEEASVPLASTLFYGVRGKQMRESEQPSFFNPVEASVVAELVSGLLASPAGVRREDIGIIAPYRKQVAKIRVLLRQRGLSAIRVGTVDDYQGQEERVVFISTVLSKPESLPPSGGLAGNSSAALAGSTEVQTSAFFSNPKRFNVAITRAKALLVVVGHPAVLLADASWRELLRHCLACGAFRGAGSDTIRRLFRFDAGAAAGALPELPAGVAGESGQQQAANGQAAAAGGDAEGQGAAGRDRAGDEGAGDEEQDEELQTAICQLAELALLGAGHAGSLYPENLDEMYEAAADEAPFRVVL